MNNSRLYDYSETQSRVERAHRRATGEALGAVGINLLIKHCAWLISDVMNDALKPFGLCYKNYVIMVLIYSNSDNTANPSDLCLGMGETRSNMTRLCDELVERGWAQRVTNPEDRRRVDLSLTSEGIALLEKVLPMLRTRNKAVYSVFNEQQTQEIEDQLIHLMQSLEAHRDV